MVTMKCLLWQPMVFVNGYHWFVRLHLVGSTVFTGLCGYIWWADDGYGEMSAWATHGVCHRVSLDCAATMGMMATMTVKCLLGQLMVFVTGYHSQTLKTIYFLDVILSYLKNGSRLSNF